MGLGDWMINPFWSDMVWGFFSCCPLTGFYESEQSCLQLHCASPENLPCCIINLDSYAAEVGQPLTMCGEDPLDKELVGPDL